MKDVKREIEEELLDKLRLILDGYPDLKKDGKEEITYSFYLEVGKFCFAQEKILKPAFGEYKDREFIRILEDMMKQKTFQLLIRALGKECTSDRAESCRILSHSFVAGWKAALIYCCKNHNFKKLIQMMKALDGDARNNVHRMLIEETFV